MLVYWEKPEPFLKAIITVLLSAVIYLQKIEEGTISVTPVASGCFVYFCFISISFLSFALFLLY